jgi:putative nucleotidyltransferase with HDIG domain
MSKPRILICDENAGRRAETARVLAGLSPRVVVVASLDGALREIRDDGDIRVLVAGPTALDAAALPVLGRLKAAAPGLSIVGLLKSPGIERGLSLVREGPCDHVVAPGDLAGLHAAVRSELAKRALLDENAALLKDLRELRAERARNLKRARELAEIYDTTVENLMTALDLRDVETFGHSRTVAKYSQVLAQLLGIEDRERLNHIRIGALLHDIGKIAIPDAILHKPAALAPEEWDKIRLHPSLGYGLIKEIKLVREIGDIILFHHERYDGSGYPRGLKGEEIPFAARIFGLADALDAITAPRPYRSAQSFQAARREINAHAGTQFDPGAVDAFNALRPEKWERIRFETTSLLPNFEEFAGLIRPPAK